MMVHGTRGTGTVSGDKPWHMGQHLRLIDLMARDVDNISPNPQISRYMARSVHIDGGLRLCGLALRQHVVIKPIS